MYVSNKHRNDLKDLRTQFDKETEVFDLLPVGWVKTFVPKMKEQLFKTLGSYAEDFIVLDAKEKYGELRIYWTWKMRDYTATEVNDTIELQKDIEDIFFYYEHVSENTCALCGNPANYFSKRYELPMCEVCAKKKIE